MSVPTLPHLVLLFFLGGVIPIWFLGLYRPIRPVNGVVAAGILLASIALYEWARATIWGRRFGIGWGEHVPEALCDSGPYRYVRHPLYLAYLLASLAALVAMPHWLTAALFAAYVALFTHAARTDEAKIAASPIAADYAAYRKRAGMFWPKFSSAAPGR